MSSKTIVFPSYSKHYSVRIIWILNLVDSDSVVSMTAERDTKWQLCGYIDVNPFSHSRDNNTHSRRKHGEL